MQNFVMNKFLISISVIILIIFSCGCTSRMSPDELNKYITDLNNGFRGVKTINEVQIEVLYIPTDALVYQHIGYKMPKKLNIDSINKIRNVYKPYHYVKLSLSYAGSEIFAIPQNKVNYGKLLNQLAFGMANYVSLMSSENEKLIFVESNYAPSYGFSPKTEILLVFRRENTKAKYLKLQLKEFGLKTGDLKFRISNYNKKLEIF